MVRVRRVLRAWGRGDTVLGVVIVAVRNFLHAVLELFGFKIAATRDRKRRGLAAQALLTAGAGDHGGLVCFDPLGRRPLIGVTPGVLPTRLPVGFREDR